MDRAIEGFRENIRRVNHLGGLHQSLDTLTSGVVDKSDILRAQLVLSVSALDHYVHEVTRYGMVKIFEGKRAKVPGFEAFKLPMNRICGSPAVLNSADFESEIRKQHGFLTFQQPDKIAEAIRKISDIKLWAQVGAHLSRDAEYIKDTLELIVTRRNKIAHEADVDPSYPGARWPISAASVNDAITFLSDVSEAIHVNIK